MIQLSNLQISSFVKRNAPLAGIILGLKERAFIPIAVFAVLLFLTPGGNAGCGCGSGNWDPTAFLNSDEIPGTGLATENADTDKKDIGAVPPAASRTRPEDRSSTYPYGQIMRPLLSLSSSDVVVDASSSAEYRQSHIRGAISLPAQDLLENDGSLKAVEELTGILGAAGISRTDSVVIYTRSLPPGENCLAFLVLYYLGQDASVLDGSLDDWGAAGLPLESKSNTLSAVSYVPDLREEVLANYDYVISSNAQVMDVRSFDEFGKGRIPDSIYLDPTRLQNEGRLKDAAELKDIFDRLDKDRPVVVYSSDYRRTALTWYALKLMGYDARTYSWQDWIIHQSEAKNDRDTLNEADIPGNDRFTRLGKT